MSWLVTGKQYIPAVIGEEFGGGYFAGYISHTADGNPTHALIVASRQQIGGKYAVSGTGYTGSTTLLAWASGAAATNVVTTGVSAGATLTAYNARKDFDGVVTIEVMKINSYGLSDTTYPAAYFVDNINAAGGFNGYTDWYLPSKNELDIAYFNLKPDNSNNSTSSGLNPNAVPARNATYIVSYPTQTTVTNFTTTAERFEFSGLGHLSATELSATVASNQRFNTGVQRSDAKTTALTARAFRRIAL